MLDNVPRKVMEASAEIANSIMKAQDLNAAQTACAIAWMASVVAGDDPEAKTALAACLVELIRDLDSDVFNAVWN